ncbi:hypothetical protein FB471_4093 [Amycolatopsis cihanbeyliensis]|uniref:Uncharacterized protein n=1 Tax=Amycolatopsis cihanbeyliensis TaxID=1128664 RepID=A0A542DMJ5_AMYCI|nr:hypothetical protein FB471_4093 [Amycolatopsis cihanbeyliensis]
MRIAEAARSGLVRLDTRALTPAPSLRFPVL